MKLKDLIKEEAFSKADKHTFKGFLGVIEHVMPKILYNTFPSFAKIKFPGNYWSNQNKNGKIEDYMKSKLRDEFKYIEKYYMDNKAKSDKFSSKYGPSWMFKN